MPSKSFPQKLSTGYLRETLPKLFKSHFSKQFYSFHFYSSNSNKQKLYHTLYNGKKDYRARLIIIIFISSSSNNSAITIRAVLSECETKTKQ